MEPLDPAHTEPPPESRPQAIAASAPLAMMARAGAG